METLEEAREFRTYPWIRCPTCRTVTSQHQLQFDQYLAEKKEAHTRIFKERYVALRKEGYSPERAREQANYEAEIEADKEFNQKLNKLGIERYCCRRTLFNPILFPLGTGAQLSPDVEVGRFISRNSISPLTTMQGEVEPQKPRLYKAR